MNAFQKELLFDSRKKSTFVAYLLGAILGGLGLHRIYLKDYTYAGVILCLFLLSFAIPLAGVLHLILVLLDVFLTYSEVKGYNKRVRREIEGLTGE